MDDLDKFCCQNSNCHDFGKRGVGNLRWHGRSGGQRLHRLLLCRTCGKYFSERKGTALYGTRLPQEKSLAVLEHLAEGCGVRQTARLVKVHRDTVSRMLAAAGRQARCLHEEEVAFSPSDEGTADG